MLSNESSYKEQFNLNESSLYVSFLPLVLNDDYDDDCDSDSNNQKRNKNAQTHQNILTLSAVYKYFTLSFAV